jgi:DNA-binding GntR family transcriptional regulator
MSAGNNRPGILLKYKKEMSVTDTGTASEHIYKKIRGMIECGDLKPGMRLIQRDLAKRLNTSNIPIVEAIRRLEHDGLVVSKPNCGAQVVDMSSVEDIESAVLIRSALEQAAARLCTLRASDEQLAKLKDMSVKYKEHAMAKNQEEARDSDASLHSYIAKCSGSRLLVRMLGNSRVITNTIYNIFWFPPNSPVPDIHDALIDAIVSRDADLAEQLAKTHIEKTLITLCQVARERGLHSHLPSVSLP